MSFHVRYQNQFLAISVKDVKLTVGGGNHLRSGFFRPGLVHHEDRAVRVGDAGSADRSEQQAGKTAMPAASDH